LRNIFKRREKTLTAAPAVVDALRNGGWAPFPLLGGGSRERIMDAFNTAQSANYGWMYANSPAVRTVIDVIVRNVGQLELRLYEEVSEAERQPLPDHPAALSLRYPNETTTADSFRRSMFKDFLIYDNAYALLIPAGEQISLVRIPAYMMEVKSHSLFQAELYRVWQQGAWTAGGMWGGAGTPIDFLPGQILHWHGEHPLDPRVGISHLDTLRDVIAEDAALQAATVELANSGLQSPAWVFRPTDAPEWSNSARAGFEEDLTNRLRRRNSRPVVLEEGMEMRSFGVSPQDAQMLEVRRWAVERVATAFGVPLAVVGLGTGRAENLADAQAQLYTDTLLPYCEDFTRMLNQRILVREYNWTEGCFEFSFDEKLMGNDRLRAFVTATGRPVMLTNEARAKVNLPPVDGGDELVTPMNVTVGDNPLPSQGVMPPQDPNGPPQDGSYRSGDGSADTTPKALVKAQEYTPLPQLHPGRKGELERQGRNVDEAQAVVERHLNRVERQLKKIATKASSKAAEADWERWDREFSDDIDRLVGNIVDKEGSIYAFKLGGEFDMGRVRNYLRAMAEGAAKGINDSLRSEVDTIGLDGALSRHAAHVSSAGTSLGVAATTWAREEAARQSPGAHQRVKTWIADTDRHAEFDGDTVAIGEDWPAGFAPGGAPNCACSMSIT
jgi:HK97 family phage portal protein